MKIKTLYPNWLVSKNATDFLYKYDLKSMCEKHDIELDIQGGFLVTFFSNFYILLTYLIRKLPLINRVLRSKYYWGIKRYLYLPSTQFKYDVIFTNNLIPFNKQKQPIILEADFLEYGSSDEIKARVRSQLYIPTGLLLNVKKIVVRSEESIKKIREQSEFLAEKCIVIPHYMPYIKRINCSELNKKLTCKDKLKVVFVGNQAKRKGIEKLIDFYTANKRVLDEKFEFSIVSNFTDGLINIPSEFICHQGVDREGVLNILKDSDIFIMPTKEEAFGKVFVEAMAAGCVTFVPDLYPLNKYFGHGAILYSIDDDAALKSKMLELHKRLDLRKIKVESSLRLFDEKYSAEVVEYKYIELFRSLR
ncbi:glycosyltransferase family 4 protein [Photobacterium leiognathi]|uniref:glycosyltransferase family 4 protein n=1 Tax=Photobacterium leiognathi TaxID=553611 RepID=UPI00273414AE|nr:glycosyltransferase family 4 protein [Photobacterium leiognathi]